MWVVRFYLSFGFTRYGMILVRSVTRNTAVSAITFIGSLT